MHAQAAAIVAAARACVGTRFRAQGRLPGTALDCVGVALVAAAAAGAVFEIPRYALSGDHQWRLDIGLSEQGCRLVTAPASGDLLVLAPAPGRRHLGIVTPGGLVHTHAGLGRVVEGSLDPAWVVIGAWRFPEPKE